MLSESEVRGLFRDESTYNFRGFLEKACEEKSPDGNSQKIINTLELFSYGNVSVQRANPEAFLVLDSEEERKLVELSILSVLNQNVGNEIRLADLLPGVEPVCANYHSLESHLINMIELGVIQVKVDEIKETVFVTETPLLRDAYNADKHTLRVLTQEDVAGASVQQAKAQLKSWLDEKVIPNSRAYGEQV